MSDPFRSFDQAASAALRQISQDSLDRAFVLMRQRQWDAATDLLRVIDLRDLAQPKKDEVSRCFYEAGKAAIVRGAFPDARDRLKRASELGGVRWHIEQRVALLNRPCGGPGFDRACDWANRLAAYVRPPEHPVRVFHLDGVFSLSVYRWQGDREAQDELSTLIRRLKHEPAGGVCNILAVLLRDCMKERAADFLCADLVMPVPADPDRTIERGFDNVAHLAEEMQRACYLPLGDSILVKARGTPDLRQVPRSARRGLLRGAFAVDRQRGTRLKNASVLLVDDVITSGATLDACAEVLKANGASRVFGCTVTRSESSA